MYKRNDLVEVRLYNKDKERKEQLLKEIRVLNKENYALEYNCREFERLLKEIKDYPDTNLDIDGRTYAPVKLLSNRMVLKIIDVLYGKY